MYTDLRTECQATGGVQIGIRHVESLIRIAEAHARIRLHDAVDEDDISFAIKTTLDSFINAQKYAVTKTLSQVWLTIIWLVSSLKLILHLLSLFFLQHFSRYLKYSRNSDDLLLYWLRDLVNEALKIQRYIAEQTKAAAAAAGVGVGAGVSGLVTEEEKVSEFELPKSIEIDFNDLMLKVCCFALLSSVQFFMYFLFLRFIQFR